MREITARQISAAVRELCMKANYTLTDDLCRAMDGALAGETSPLGREVLGDLIENRKAARECNLPICQDTGLAVVFAELGQEVHITGGTLQSAVDAGVSAGYLEGYLRCSVVADPLRRKNTGDNTPAILHVALVEGDRLTLTVAPKGAGSENMSVQRMLSPSASKEDVCDFVVDAVRAAGSKPCPPVIVGVGLGGDFELCALLSKRALCRSLDEPHPDPYYREMEEGLLRRINALGIGPQGFGGSTTALGVHILAAPTHIACLPAAVSLGCHVTRHQSATL